MSEMKEQLLQVSLRTLEELAFLMPIPEEEIQFPDDLEITTTVVSFSGYCRGCLYISVANSILPALAQNILAEDNTPTQQQQLDALKEVANVICGNILPFIAGDEKIFRLSSPEIVEKIDDAFTSADYCEVSTKIAFDEGITEITWFYEKPK